MIYELFVLITLFFISEQPSQLSNSSAQCVVGNILDMILNIFFSQSEIAIQPELNNFNITL